MIQLTLAAYLRRPASPRLLPSRSGDGGGWVLCSGCGAESLLSHDRRRREQRCGRCRTLLVETVRL